MADNSLLDLDINNFSIIKLLFDKVYQYLFKQSISVDIVKWIHSLCNKIFSEMRDSNNFKLKMLSISVKISTVLFIFLIP